MALPLAAATLIAGLVTAGVQAYGAWRNRKSQEKQNQIDRDRAEKQAQTERSWSLADWEAVNRYNHPLEQMNRLRQAGLNPHLVYGKGADNTAPMLRSTQYQNPKQDAPMMDYSSLSGIPNAIMAYQNAKVIAAQTDNIQAAAEVAKSEKLLKDAQIGKTIADTAYTKTQHEQATRVMDSVVRKYELENANIEQNIKQSQAYVKNMADQNQREWEKHNLNLNNLAQDAAKKKVEILQIKATTAKTEQEISKITAEISAIEQQVSTGAINQRILEIQKNLWEKGISPNDPYYFRIASTMLDKAMGIESIQDTPIEISDETKQLFEKWKNNRRSPR